MSSEPRSNHLLELLDADTRAALSAVAVQLHAREVLYEPGAPPLYAYFPTGAVISLVSTMENGASTEVALIGHEGMVGLAGVLGTVEGTTAAVVQFPGDAYRVPSALLRRERLRLPSLRRVMDLYIQARLIQVAQTAACNRLHSVEARLARWLLAVADRVDAEYFRLSQELIAQILGVHRPTVSVALQALRDAGVVVYAGRSIKVADRVGLERIACECHGILRREFVRLLRSPVESPGALPHVRGRTAATETEPAAALETMREISGRLLLAIIREQEARDEAAAATRAKDQFLAMVSHELRTPLNAILGWSAILSDQPDESPARGLRVIRRNAEALVKLVEELLEAAHVTADTFSIQPSPVNLRDIVCSAVDAVTPAAELKGVSVRTTIPDELPLMTGDPDRLRQVFLNVLSNGLRFTEKGDDIEVCVGVRGASARVTIRDSGTGIAPDELPHVFERFRQGADARARQGLGLGLTIARALIELHRGTIHIVSPGVGRGTTCTIELPLTSPVTVESLPNAAGAGGGVIAQRHRDY